MTQQEMYYRAVRRSAEANELFLELARDGMTAEELKKNIARRPALWARFSNWIDKLPEK